MRRRVLLKAAALGVVCGPAALGRTIKKPKTQKPYRFEGKVFDNRVFKLDVKDPENWEFYAEADSVYTNCTFIGAPVRVGKRNRFFNCRFINAPVDLTKAEGSVLRYCMWEGDPITIKGTVNADFVFEGWETPQRKDHWSDS